MVQSPIQVANGTGLQVRSGLNNAELTLASNFLGASAPSPSYAGQFWWDTSSTDAVLKMRNKNNDGWATLGTLLTATNVFIPSDVLLKSGGTITGQLISTLITGLPPLVIASTTKVSNLNVDLLDGYHAGNSANQVLVLDGTGKVPSGNLPSIEGIPAGSILWATGNAALSGTIKGNGALISRTTYANLWAYAQASNNLVSDTAWLAGSFGAYSTGNGSTTFRVPDLRAMILKAWDDSRGIDAGRTFGSYQEDAAKGYTVTGRSQVTNWQPDGTGSVIGYALTVGSVDSINNSENKVKNLAYLACIKY